jgi:hypothetical protein
MLARDIVLIDMTLGYLAWALIIARPTSGRG